MSDDLFHIPATRRSDPVTSHKAADTMAKGVATIRARVLEYGASRPEGIIDEELAQLDPDSPYSSYTKRRTELTQEGWFVNSGRERLNSHGNSQTVWLHRDFAHAPPPLQERKATKPADTTRADGRAMAHALATYADSMKKEGRAMFAAELQKAAELMARLAR